MELLIRSAAASHLLLMLGKELGVVSASIDAHSELVTLALIIVGGVAAREVCGLVALAVKDIRRLWRTRFR